MVESFEKALQSLDINSPKAKKLHRSDLSLDINEILEIDSEVESLECQNSKVSVEAEKVKCCPTFLGVVDSPRFGYNYRTCSALHCRNCDFSVSSFPNHEWNEHVEYLFLRTNMPNFEKVSEKLIRKSGSVAYACHCVSFSTNKLRNLHEEDLPWFCRGHASNSFLFE